MSCIDPATLAEFSSGKLDPRRAERVQQHVATCSACRATSTRVKRITDTLQVIADVAPPSQSRSARLEATLRWTRIDAEPAPDARPRRLRWSLAAAAVLVLSAGALSLWRHHRSSRAGEVAPQLAQVREPEPPPPALPTTLRAVVTLVGGEARVGHEGAQEPIDPSRALREKDRVVTAPDGRVAFQWGEGSGALLDGGSELLLSRLEPHAQELSLERGRVSVRVGPHQPGESLRVVSPDHTVTVHGTWFLVGVEAKGTRVEVLEGVVEIGARAGDGATTRLTAPSRAFFPRERGVADGERALTGREAQSLRLQSEMGLLAWPGLDGLVGGTGVVRIDSQPSASVVVDGVAFGQTTLRLRRPRDRHLVELSRPGFATLRRWITIGDETEDLHVALKEEPAKVESTPATEDEVKQVVSSRRRQIAACYERVLKRNPELSGSVTMEIRIGRAGQVLGTTVEADTLKDAQVVDCLRHEAAGWAFHSARNSTIAYPFIFRAP